MSFRRSIIALLGLALFVNVAAAKPSAPAPRPYVLVLGIIQHAIYHAGQISILKKE